MSSTPRTEKSLEKSFYQSSVHSEKNMKKCNLCTVPGSSHLGFSWLQVTEVYICVMKVQWVPLHCWYTSVCFKVLTLFKKREDQEGCRIFFFLTTNLCHVSQAPPSSPVSASQCSSLMAKAWFQKIWPDSWNLTYSRTRGVPLGVAPFFFCSRLWTFRDFTTFILTSKTSWMAFRKQWKL